MIEVTSPTPITIDLTGPPLVVVGLEVSENIIQVTDPAPVVIDITASPIVTLDVNTGIVGPDGRGITDAEIVGMDLVLNYTDGTDQNVGRVVGENGTNGTNGTNGATGNGIVSITQPSGNTTALVTYTDGDTDTLNLPVGPAGLNGDRYSTTSTTSISIPNPNQQRTLTIGTGLAYTNEQTIIVATVDGSGHHWHGTVDSYNSATGSLTATCTGKTGNGTYANWEVNLSGAVGVNGYDGWSPILAVVTDSARRVLQVTDWTGGSGTKPTTGQYIGASGLVNNIADAVDIRGAVGATGPNSLSFLANNWEFLDHFAAPIIASNTNFATSVASGGTATSLYSSNDYGVIQLATTTTNTSRAGLVRLSGSSFPLPIVGTYSQQVALSFNQLPTNTNQFTARTALFNNAASPASFAGIRLVWSGSAAIFECFSNNGATETKFTAAVNPVINTWYSLAFTITNRTGLTFYINGTSVGTIATNIFAGRFNQLVELLNNSLSTTANTILLDVYQEKYTRSSNLSWLTL